MGEALAVEVWHRVLAGLAVGTRKVYRRYWEMFSYFAHLNNLTALPASVQGVAAFLLAVEGKYCLSTISSILSVIAFVHKVNLYEDPTHNFLIVKLKAGLRPKELPSTIVRKPINADILGKMLAQLPSLTSTYGLKLFKAILLLGYSACLRASEMVWTPDTTHAVKVEDVKFIRQGAGPPCEVRIKLSSFKHSTKPEYFSFKATGSPLCVVSVLYEYCSICPASSGNLFRRKDLSPVTRQMLSDVIKMSVRLVGLDPAEYNTHSLRIGRTTDLALAGFAAPYIKKVGRWTSDIYLNYIRDLYLCLPNLP